MSASLDKGDIGMRELPSMRVLGTGFFAPEYAALADVRAGVERAPVPPPFALVEGRARRFTSLVTQMHLDASGTAIRASGVDAKAVRSIFASSGGELATAVHILDSINETASVSAARFVQSVHNTPSGVFSIATGNVLSSTTIAAGSDTVAAALVEAALLCAEDPSPVLVSFGDEAVPALFRPQRAYRAFAAALVLARHGTGPTLTLCTSDASRDGRALDAGSFGDLDASPIRAAIALLEAVAAGGTHDVAVGSLASEGPWSGLSCKVRP